MPPPPLPISTPASRAERRDHADSTDDNARHPVRLHAVTIIPAVLSTGVVPQWFARPFAVGGLVFFIDALVYFAYRFVGPFAVERAGSVDVRIIVFDVMLFSVFAVHHSLFARDTIRKRITGLVGSLERSAYVWVASALFVAVCALWRPLAGATWRIDQPAAVWTLRAAQLAGVWLAVHSALMIDLFELAGLRE